MLVCIFCRTDQDHRGGVGVSASLYQCRWDAGAKVGRERMDVQFGHASVNTFLYLFLCLTVCASVAIVLFGLLYCACTEKDKST